jgi:propionyl-CoA carboxylase alpha chain
VHVGEHVARGQPLLWLEAMKMQHQIDAPATGVVTDLPVQPGQQVDEGTVLAVVEADADPVAASPGEAGPIPTEAEPSGEAAQIRTE